VFVDKSRDAILKIKENISKIKEIDKESCIIIQKTSKILLNEFTKENTIKDKERFDIIYLDPPYDKDETEEIEYIIENKILNDNSLIVYETDNQKYIDNIRKLEEKGIIEILKIKKYGRPNIIYITGR
jgi:RNA methyltransferase, rsmD family